MPRDKLIGGTPITDDDPLQVQVTGGSGATTVGKVDQGAAGSAAWLVRGRESTWTETDSSSANTAQTITHAAEAGKRHYVTAYLVVLRGAAAGNDIRIEIRDEDDNVLWDDYIGSGAPRGERVGMVFASPLEGPEGKAVKLVAAAGGTSAITTGNLAGYTV